jgi:acetoacetate decarboxylase
MVYTTSAMQMPQSRADIGDPEIRRPTPEPGSYWSRLAKIVTPAGGWLYRDAHYLVADVDVDPDRMARWIPWPLRLATPARAQVFTGYLPINSFGSVYREAGVFVDVVHRFTRAIYSPWMLVDDDVALIVGRELLGYPKKMGDIAWGHYGSSIRAVARRRGHDVITMEGQLGETLESPPPILGRPHRNVRTTTGVALPKLIAFTPRERVIEVRRARLDVRIAGSERDPLHQFGLGRVLAARLHRVDLGAGRIPVPIPVALASPLALVRHLLLRSH